jgi:exonuclease VII small subunit
VRSEQQRAVQVEEHCKDKLVEAKQRLEGLRLQKDEEVGLY